MQTASDFFIKQGVTGTSDLNKWCVHGYAFITPLNKDKIKSYLTGYIKNVDSLYIKDGGMYVYVSTLFNYVDASLVTVNIQICDPSHKEFNVFECKVNALDFDWVFNKYPESGFWSYNEKENPLIETVVLVKRTGHRKFKKIVESGYNIHIVHITSAYLKALLNKAIVHYNGTISDVYYYYAGKKPLENDKFKLFNFGKQENSSLSEIKDKFLHVVNKDWLISLSTITNNKYELYYNELLAAELDHNYKIQKLWIPSLEQEILDLPKGV